MTKQQILMYAQKEADILALKKVMTLLKEENRTLKEVNRQLVAFIEQVTADNERVVLFYQEALDTALQIGNKEKI
tara:strand:+ start:1050 stop:1274 length:225 start_codon:yes stop_codon:yes gene_type:complete